MCLTSAAVKHCFLFNYLVSAVEWFTLPEKNLHGWFLSHFLCHKKFVSNNYIINNSMFSLLVSPPFSSSEPQRIYAKILDGVLKFPPYMSEAAKSIISKLCRWEDYNLLTSSWWHFIHWLCCSVHSIVTCFFQWAAWIMEHVCTSL